MPTSCARRRRGRARRAPAGSWPPPQHSSTAREAEQAGDRRPAAQPLGVGERLAARPRRATTAPATRPTARHGRSSRKTSPTERDAPARRPRRRRRSASAPGSRSALRPREAGEDADAKTATPSDAEDDVDGERERQPRPLARPPPAAACPARGQRHEETTRTSAAATPNSARGIGRSARPTIPWAKTLDISSRSRRSRRPLSSAVERDRVLVAVLGQPCG